MINRTKCIQNARKSMMLVAGMFGIHFRRLVINPLATGLFSTGFSVGRAGRNSLTTGVKGMICVTLEYPESFSFLLGLVTVSDLPFESCL